MARAEDWRDGAACLQYPAEWWFPLGTGEVAQRICRDCPVIAECLAYALDHHIVGTGGELAGIWGGTTRMQRRRMRTASS